MEAGPGGHLGLGGQVGPIVPRGFDCPCRRIMESLAVFLLNLLICFERFALCFPPEVSHLSSQLLSNQFFSCLKLFNLISCNTGDCHPICHIVRLILTTYQHSDAYRYVGVDFQILLIRSMLSLHCASYIHMFIRQQCTGCFKKKMQHSDF